MKIAQSIYALTIGAILGLTLVYTAYQEGERKSRLDCIKGVCYHVQPGL